MTGFDTVLCWTHRAGTGQAPGLDESGAFRHATLDGMASTRASGKMTVCYGSMRELVPGLTLELPDG